MSAVAKNETAIARRAIKFLKSTKTHAPGVASLFEALRPLGDVLLFGGLLRNAAIFGLEGFRSDIDIVVALEGANDLGTVLTKYNPKRTAFGGYRLGLDSFQIDIWSLKATWAFQAGLVKDSTIQNLPRTTFFNWDSIAMSLQSGRLFHRENYIDDVRRNFLDIVLMENPNPVGMVRRTINLVKNASAHLSPRLARFVLETISSEEYETKERKTNLWNDYTAATVLVPILRESLIAAPSDPVRIAWQMNLWNDGITLQALREALTSKEL